MSDFEAAVTTYLDSTQQFAVHIQKLNPQMAQGIFNHMRALFQGCSSFRDVFNKFREMIAPLDINGLLSRIDPESQEKILNSMKHPSEEDDEACHRFAERLALLDPQPSFAETIELAIQEIEEKEIPAQIELLRWINEKGKGKLAARIQAQNLLEDFRELPGVDSLPKRRKSMSYD
jgi:hypothetical protein